MTQFILSASEAIFLGASFYGWGRLVDGWLNGWRPSGWAYPAALGIAVLMALGGLLNAVGIARPMVLLSLSLLGLCLAVLFACRALARRGKPNVAAVQSGRDFAGKRAGGLLYLAFVLLVFCFLVAALMPARTFNFHDDFHAYFTWPVRMLQTGSLEGNPFGHLGVSSLGGQSFIQGLFLTFGSLRSINVFDTVLCLVLVLGILKEMASHIGATPVFYITAGLLALFINPQYVNISSLYSGSLMLLGLVFAHVLLARPLGPKGTPAGPLGPAVECALFYAALLTLKTTYVFIIPVFWLVSVLGSWFLATERKKVLQAYFSCAALAAVFLFPWVSLYWERYWRKLSFLLYEVGYAPDTTTSVEVGRGVLATLFSGEEMLYGNTYLHYLGLVALLCFAAAMAAWTLRRCKDRQEALLLVPFLAVFLSAIVSFGLQYHFGPPRLMVRYSCPIFIGAAPAAGLLSGWCWGRGRKFLEGGAVPKKTALFVGILLLAMQLALVAAFGGTLVDRMERAAAHRTLLSFPLAEADLYKKYNDYALGSEARQRVVQIQETIPAGETLLAWSAMPFLFDYKRNFIYTVNESSLAYNLLVMPLADGVERMREYFRRFGIRYVIWDYNSAGMKKPAKLGSLQNDFIRILEGLIGQSEVRFNDGATIVLDIGQAR